MFLNLLSSIFKFKYLKIYKRNLKSSSTIILEKDTCSFFQKIKRFSKLGEKTLPNPSAKKKNPFTTATTATFLTLSTLYFGHCKVISNLKFFNKPNPSMYYYG